MEQYRNNIFYDSKPVFKHLDEFKKEVQEKAYKVILEVKYEEGSKDFGRRVKTKKSLDWILNLCTGKSHRSGRKDDGQIRILHVMPNFGETEKFQIVFNVDPGDGWYFAWFDLELIHEDYFVNKYKLKIL